MENLTFYRVNKTFLARKSKDVQAKKERNIIMFKHDIFVLTQSEDSDSEDSDSESSDSEDNITLDIIHRSIHYRIEKKNLKGLKCKMIFTGSFLGKKITEICKTVKNLKFSHLSIDEKNRVGSLYFDKGRIRLIHVSGPKFSIKGQGTTTIRGNLLRSARPQITKEAKAKAKAKDIHLSIRIVNSIKSYISTKSQNNATRNILKVLDKADSNGVIMHRERV